MNHLKTKLLSLVFFLSISLALNAQTTTKEEKHALKAAKKERKDSIKNAKNFRYSIIGGPGYTPDYGFLIGGAALTTFSADPSDKNLKRSVLPTSFSIMFNGGGSLQVKPQIFLKEDKHRIWGNFYYRNTLENYYGVGYEDAVSVPRGENTTEYRNIGYKINPEFLRRMGKSDIFTGITLDWAREDLRNPAEGMIEDPTYIEDGGTENGVTYDFTGLGAKIYIDTRDIPANAFSGVYLNLDYSYYFDLPWTNTEFSTLTIDYRQYKKLDFISERSVIAWTALGVFNFGDVPFTQLASVGSPFDLRGYYKGQFRDQNSMLGIIEYRHMFESKGSKWINRFLRKTGFAAWTGLGYLQSPTYGISKPLPNYGAGLRIELQPRMNFRLDLGVDPVTNQTLIYFNMTEAF